MSDILDSSALGKEVRYSSTYNPQLLFPVSRSKNRELLVKKDKKLPFFGWDIWNAYELSWLNMRGKPQCAVGCFVFPYDSENIIESKSLKLYLNSLNEEKFKNDEFVTQLLERDLSRASCGKTKVTLSNEDSFNGTEISRFSGADIDSQDIDFYDYMPNKNLLLNSGDKIVSEILYSNLFKSNCPVTGQPDWASVQISYKGRAISKEGLLKYLVSFRRHSGFHENCVEKIFYDIMERCKPEVLTVHARFTRRGGLDINPIRTNDETLSLPLNIRLFRQ